MKVELAHDFIAKKIYDEASAEDKARAKASRFLHERYHHYLNSKGLLLNQQELLYVEPYYQDMELEAGEEQYIAQSQSAVKKKKFRAKLKDSFIVALVCAVVFSTWGFWERSRYADTFKQLSNAQDSIDVLMRNIQSDGNSINENLDESPSYSLNSPTELYSTINIAGTVQDPQNQPVAHAMVKVLGAEIFTDENGKFQIHLVLSPQDLKNEVLLRVSKPNYTTASQNIDIEKNNLNLNFSLKQE